jgi:hypothetical protein
MRDGKSSITVVDFDQTIEQDYISDYPLQSSKLFKLLVLSILVVKVVVFIVNFVLLSCGIQDWDELSGYSRGSNWKYGFTGAATATYALVPASLSLMVLMMNVGVDHVYLVAVIYWITPALGVLIQLLTMLIIL